MYNRYIRSDSGVYTRIPEEEPFHSWEGHGQNHQKASRSKEETHASDTPKDPTASGILNRLPEWLNGLKERLHLDAGDLLLVALLYFLYREDADEELLIALALLLIL